MLEVYQKTNNNKHRSILEAAFKGALAWDIPANSPSPPGSDNPPPSQPSTGTTNQTPPPGTDNPPVDGRFNVSVHIVTWIAPIFNDLNRSVIERSENCYNRKIEVQRIIFNLLDQYTMPVIQRLTHEAINRAAQKFSGVEEPDPITRGIGYVDVGLLLNNSDPVRDIPIQHVLGMRLHFQYNSVCSSTITTVVHMIGQIQHFWIGRRIL
jgi:hypothetical protein